ncbi:MAG: DUF2313 domain-containing protein [Oscillospiraceae bacterium]
MEPLGIYKLDGGFGAEELCVIGAQLDEVFAALEELLREGHLTTASSFGLRKLEELLPYRPAYITTEDARRAIMALLRIREGCFTLGELSSTLSGCGLNATIEEGEKPQTAIVKFPQNRGIPQGFDDLKLRIEEIVPCHLAVQYTFIYTSWRELMQKLTSWRDLESKTHSWRELEIC